ncbi:signal recognition particle-docking protein FtsY [bacterium]|nr:signal recognition particle-docking protein FtsY [bacterium]
MNFFRKIAKGLSKTRDAVVGGIREAVGAALKLDEETLEKLEEILITADLGVETSMELIERLRKRLRLESVTAEDVLRVLREELDRMIEETVAEKETEGDEEEQPRPHVTFVVGVNGTGKTTTLGKIANRYAKQGESVLIVAADTFRTAAVEQVAIWAERAGVDIVRGATGADPASVVYDGLSAALSRNVQRVLVDTAGRLHTKTNLMAELGKLDRVAKKLVPEAPHEVLLVVDGTTGQNGLSQAKAFAEVSGVTALVVTKLDGTAKGGVLVPIGRELGIPVRWIGLGEGIDDLVPFEPRLVVEAVFGDEASLALAEQAESTESSEEADEQQEENDA